MQISVVVPTYKRLNDLKRCLSALDNQESLPHEVIVVVRASDLETLVYLQSWISQATLYCRKLCTVSIPGQVQALIKGLNAVSGEIVAFTDDDAAPAPTWLSRMQWHYRTPKVGGVGGRDILFDRPLVPLKMQVGELTWYGKLIGNHHIGCGPPREVSVLKGVNMSFRTQLVEFPSFLRGSGAQTHNEVGTCLRIKRLGYLLVYDPTVTVTHYASPRVDTEQRAQFNAMSVENSAFNIQMSLLTWLPWHKKLLRLVYSTLIGDKAYPGVMRFLMAVARQEAHVVKSYIPAQVGFLIAIANYCGGIFLAGSPCPRDPSESGIKSKITTEDA